MAILTLAELRQHIDYPTGTDADTALQLLLDASEEVIVKAAGASGAVTEFPEAGWSKLVLNRPILTITTLTVDYDSTTPLVLSADDYRFTVGGYVLSRLSDGTNPAYGWAGTVQVVYAAVDDTETRKAAQLALVRLTLAYHPGLTAQTIGDWSEMFSSNSVMNYAIERDLILSTLGDGPRFSVI